MLSLKTKNSADKKICVINSAMTSEVLQGMYSIEEFSPAYDLLGTYISLKSPDSIFHSTLGRMCGPVIKERDYEASAWFVLNFACNTKQILQLLWGLVFPSVKWEW